MPRDECRVMIGCRSRCPYHYFSKGVRARCLLTGEVNTVVPSTHLELEGAGSRSLSAREPPHALTLRGSRSPVKVKTASPFLHEQLRSFPKAG
ncbi:hypothetical protein E2C01_028578 [Portunus trituberculatus]|uniref:Uncharacterized protein n=1 Tax=Portunus trituberculatus TaxID=210409 RepID=A0A5B7EL13_PORTR|nr:hypothetical protein [Portunus trituberculatus]